MMINENEFFSLYRIFYDKVVSVHVINSLKCMKSLQNLLILMVSFLNTVFKFWRFADRASQYIYLSN